MQTRPCLPAPALADPQALLEDLGVQDTQHDVAAAAHAEVLDQLLALHRKRLGAVHARFQGDLRAMQEEHERCGCDAMFPLTAGRCCLMCWTPAWLWQRPGRHVLRPWQRPWHSSTRYTACSR